MESITKSAVYSKIFHPFERRRLLNEFNSNVKQLGTFQTITMAYVYSHAELYKEMLALDADDKKQVKAFFGKAAAQLNTAVDPETGEKGYRRYRIRDNLYFVFGWYESYFVWDIDSDTYTAYAGWEDNPDEILKKALDELERRETAGKFGNVELTGGQSEGAV